MAKEKVNKNKTNQQIEEKSPGIFQKLFYLVFIPLLFVIAILLGIASFTNFNVFEKASELIDSFKSEEVSTEETTKNYDQKIVELEAQVKEKEAEIEQLQSQLQTAKDEKQTDEAEKEQLKYEIEKLQREQSETQKEFDDILKSYEEMSAKSAAPIIVEMNDDEALKILSNMQPETLSAILSKMEPADAARYTELLSK
ncbi:hypothetical protein H9636_03775 [Ureibacillus sp. Re31]|uniref:Magnesium transporter MgtE intracellular domain-containing protein n=1 Tax=Ureibacillus galli TaxID=2762222 RepID=A0ABR8X8Y4_9BACL|nr:hypothetical protein [Ureibacillus galli]MBD8025770.1 hypothetical protein [Ureibacillus galli]